MFLISSKFTILFIFPIFYKNCFKPVETLQDLEQLTSDVLLPLFSHRVVQDLMRNLRYV